ncbi:MAG: adenylosuccinate lyase [Pseudobdellovibrio sp.]
MINRYQTEEMRAVFNEESRFHYMLKVEIAVAEVQSKRGVIPQKAYLDIKNKSEINYKRILEIEKTTKHDVIAFVSQIAETVGKNGRYIHFGLTSSDVLDTALSLQIHDAFLILEDDVSLLKQTLRKLVKKYKATLCAGRTHGIFAEITTFGFKLAGFLSEISRAEKRVKTAHEQFRICKLSGAVGTSASFDMSIEADVAKKLKLKVEPFATQVIPRDRHAEVFMSLAFLASALERLSVELRHLQRSEVSEVIEGFSLGQKGSSAMPHKKNPISAENITGLARLIKGYAWTSFENIPLWHERDISHSSNERIIFGDSFTATHYIVRRMNGLLSGLYIDKERMLENSHMLGGVLYSSHLLLHLVDKHNLSREEAYSIIQKMAHSMKKGEHLKDVIKNNFEVKRYFTDAELKELFSGKRYLTAIQKRIQKYEKEL